VQEPEKGERIKREGDGNQDDTNTTLHFLEVERELQRGKGSQDGRQPD